MWWWKGLSRCDAVKRIELGVYPELSGWALSITTNVLVRERQGEFHHMPLSPRRCFPYHLASPQLCLPLALDTPDTSPMSPLEDVPLSSVCPAHYIPEAWSMAQAE